MFALVKKDFVALKNTIIVMLIYIPVLGILFGASDGYLNSSYVNLPISVLMGFYICTTDIAYSNLILSLPTSRKKYLMYKYILFICFSVIFLSIVSLESYIISSIFNLKALASIFDGGIFISFICILSSFTLAASILIPLNLFLGLKGKKLQKESQFITLIIVMVFTSLCIEGLKYMLLNSLNPLLIGILILLISLIVSIISFKITLIFFKKIDL